MSNKDLGVNLDYIHGIESNYGKDPRSRVPNAKGAIGHYQITPIMFKDLQQWMPEKYNSMKFTDLLDPRLSKQAAIDAFKILKRYLNSYKVPITEESLAASYNMGAKGYADTRGDFTKLPKETQDYILKYRAKRDQGLRADRVGSPNQPPSLPPSLRQSSSSFGEAFKNARRAGLNEFNWQGKRFNTELK